MTMLNFSNRDAGGEQGSESQFAVFGHLRTYYRLLERLAKLKDELKALEANLDGKEEGDSVAEEKRALADLTHRIRAHTALISELYDQIPPSYDYYSLLFELQKQQRELKHLERKYRKDKIREGAFQAKRTALRQKISELEKKLRHVLTLAHEYLGYLRSQLHALEDTRVTLKRKYYTGEVSKEAYAELKVELEKKKEHLRERLKYTNKHIIRLLKKSTHSG